MENVKTDVSPFKLTPSDQKVMIVLIAIYTFFIMIRVLLRSYSSPNPYIVPDEMLYYNLSRSIHLGQGLSVHGQPVSFISILYSILLSPLYGLPVGKDIFGTAQLVNIVLMNTAVFPVYFLSKRLGCTKGVCIGICVLSLLLPDLFMSGRYMTEALVYPLFLWTFLACARLMERQGTIRTVILIILLFLLYLVKEGGVALTAAFCGVLLWNVLEKKQWKQLIVLVEILVGFFVLYGCWRLILTYVFKADLNIQTVYQIQYEEFSMEHIIQTLGGMLLYLLFIPVGFGVLPFILPLSGCSKRPEERKQLLRLVYIALAMYVAGICYLIFCDEMYDGIYHSRIHLRYVFPFLPLLLAALFSEDMKDIRPDFRVIAGFSIFLALLLTLGLYAFSSGVRYPVDSPLLAFLDYDNDIVNIRIPAQIILIAGSGLSLYSLYRYGWQAKMKKAFVILFVIQLFISNLAVYENNQYSMDRKLNEDAIQASEWLDGSDAILVSEWRDGYFESQLNAVDVQLRQSLPIGALEDVCQEMGNSDFLLPAYWVAGAGNEKLNPEYVLCNNRALNLMVLDEACEVQVTNGGYFIKISVPEDGVWLHSAVAGLSEGNQVSSETAFWLFDPALLSQSALRLTFWASAENDTQLSLICEGEEYNYVITSGIGEYYLDLPIETGRQALEVEIRTLGNVTFNTYTIGPALTD